MGPVYITAVGSALPSRTLSNEQIVAGMPWLDVSAEWVREHTGIRQRHVAQPGEWATDLGLRAACQALERTPAGGPDTDLILLATNTAQYVYPAGAAMIQEALLRQGHAMGRAAAMDLQQGCASFVAGIILAAAMIQGGNCRQVLVVGADVATRMVDWTDRSSVLLGDGAAACVVSDRRPVAGSATPALQILGSFMRTAPDRDSIFQRGGLVERNDPFEHIDFAAGRREFTTREQLQDRLDASARAGEDHYFHMDGRKVYKFVRRTVPGSGYFEVLLRAGLIDDAEFARLASGHTGQDPIGDQALRAAVGRRIDRFIPHGANMMLNQELADQMHIPYERMALTLQEHGNTSAASVGIALDRILHGSIRYETIAKRDGEGKLTRPAQQVVVEPLRAGHSALLLSFGAGTSWNYVATRAV